MTKTRKMSGHDLFAFFIVDIHKLSSHIIITTHHFAHNTQTHITSSGLAIAETTDLQAVFFVSPLTSPLCRSCRAERTVFAAAHGEVDAFEVGEMRLRPRPRRDPSRRLIKSRRTATIYEQWHPRNGKDLVIPRLRTMGLTGVLLHGRIWKHKERREPQI